MSTSALLCAKSAPERSRSAMASAGAGTAVAVYLVLVTGVFVTVPLLGPRDAGVRAPCYFVALAVLGYLASRTPSGWVAGSSRSSCGRR